VKAPVRTVRLERAPSMAPRGGGINQRAIRHWLRVLVIPALVTYFTATAGAQDSTAADHVWKTFYISVSPGWGNLNDACSGSCGTNDWTSTCCFTLNMRAGYALGTRWRLGIETDNAAHVMSTQAVSGAGSTFPPQAVSFISLAGTYYPISRSRFWVSVDAGVAVHLPSDVSISSGFSAGGGFGYDWLPGGGTFAIVPMLNLQQQFSGGSLNGSSTTVRAGLFQIAIGVGYQH
jgi:hypothetical protein